MIPEVPAGTDVRPDDEHVRSALGMLAHVLTEEVDVHRGLASRGADAEQEDERRGLALGLALRACFPALYADRLAPLGRAAYVDGHDVTPAFDVAQLLTEAAVMRCTTTWPADAVGPEAIDARCVAPDVRRVLSGLRVTGASAVAGDAPRPEPLDAESVDVARERLDAALADLAGDVEAMYDAVRAGLDPGGEQGPYLLAVKLTLLLRRVKGDARRVIDLPEELRAPTSLIETVQRQAVLVANGGGEVDDSALFLLPGRRPTREAIDVVRGLGEPGRRGGIVGWLLGPR